jgi:hypothetical protein
MRHFISKILGMIVNKLETPIAVLKARSYSYEFDVEGHIDDYWYLINCRSDFKPNFSKFDSK